MELQTAIEILEYHQEWRLGKRDDMIHEPKKLTEAFDIVLSEVKKNRLGGVSNLVCDCCVPSPEDPFEYENPICSKCDGAMKQTDC